MACKGRDNIKDFPQRITSKHAAVAGGRYQIIQERHWPLWIRASGCTKQRITREMMGREGEGVWRVATVLADDTPYAVGDFTIRVADATLSNYLHGRLANRKKKI